MSAPDPFREAVLEQHGRLHSAAVAGGESWVDRTFTGLDDGAMRRRPASGGNSLAWLLWHIARTEDAAVNLVVVAGTQVLDAAWARRLGVARPDIGTGMTAEEVADLSTRVDLDALRAYRDAVGRRTREIVARLSEAEWATRLTAADIDRAAGAGAVGPRAEWLLPFWQGQTRAVRLLTVAVTHNAIHHGEAQSVRSALGLGAGR